MCVAAVMLAASIPASAGPYTDELSRCLVEKTTPDDKSALVQWIFVAMSQHPTVAPMTKVTRDDVDKHNKAVADLFMQLVTDRCVETSRKAIQNEGIAAIQQSFQVLGQAAAGELFTNPEVADMMAGFGKHLDPQKLEELGKAIKQ